MELVSSHKLLDKLWDETRLRGYGEASKLVPPLKLVSVVVYLDPVTIRILEINLFYAIWP